MTKLDDILAEHNKQEEVKKQEAAKKAPPVIPQKQENATEYKSKNEELINQIANKQFGAGTSKYQKAISKAQTQTQYQVSPEARMDLARFNYKQEKGKDGNDKEVADYLNKNQLKIEKALYGSLAKQARDKGIDLSNDQFYHSYLGDTLKSQTPKAKEEDFWTKAGNVAKGIFLDTPFGLGAMASDQVFGTNFYKGWFGERTQLKNNEGIGKQFTDLMIDQGAIVDAGIALGTFFSGGTAAPAMIAARTAIKGGMKAVTKGMFKTLEKGVMKEGIELFEKTVTKNLGEDVYKALKGEGDLAKIIADKGEDGLKFLTRMKIVMKDAGEEALKGSGNPKILKKFYNKVDEVHDSLSVGGGFMRTTGTEKIAEGINVAIDALGLPNFIGFKAVNVGGKEIIKWNKPSFVKTMVNYALPASPLLPGVGQWMESTGLRLGSVIAQKFTEQTRTGIIDVEREKFMQAYGVDPEKSTGELRKNWENFVNFKLKNSTISEALTGVQREDRGLAGQWGFGLVDVLGDFIGPMLGIKAFGKAHQIAENKLSPVTLNEKGEIVSNIGYLARLEKIQKTDYATKEERQEAIDNLHAEIEKGGTNLITTIQSTKDLENSIKKILYYHETSGKRMTEYDQEYVGKLQEAKEMFDKGDTKGASDKIMEAENFQNMAVYSVFNSERLKNVKEKIDAVNKYFDKLRNSVSLVDTLTKGFAVNFFTKNITSASGAIIRGTDSLVASAKSIFNDIDNRNQKIVDIYEQRGKALNNIFKGEGGGIDIIKSKIVDGLTNDGLTKENAGIVADVLGHDVYNALTKVYLNTKGIGDYNTAKLFDEVFGGFGLNNLVEKINEVTGKDQASGEKYGPLLLRLRGNPEGQAKLSSIAESMIKEKIALRQTHVPDTVKVIESKAKELMMLNQLKADIASKVNQSNEMSRKQMVFEDTKKVEVDIDVKIKELEAEKASLEEQRDKGAIVDKKIEKVDEAIEAVKEAKEEGNTTVEERQVISSKEGDILKDNPNLENLRAEEAHTEKLIKEIEESHLNKTLDKNKLEDEVQELSLALANMANNHILLNKFMVKERPISELPQNKLDDDMYRHEDLLNASESFIIQKLENYASFTKEVFKPDGNLDLNSLKNYDEVFKAKLDDLWKKESAKFIEANKGGNLTKTQQLALSKLITRVQDMMGKGINRANLIEMAKNTTDYHTFVDDLKLTIQTHYGFTPEATEKFIINTFGGKDVDGKMSIHNEKLLPFYNLYKNTYKIEMANLDLTNGKVVFSNEGPEVASQFLDQMGGDSSQYRIKGIEQSKLEKDYDIFFVNDIRQDGKSIMPDQFFVKEPGKDTTNKQEWNNVVWKQVSDEMTKRGYFFLGSFQEEGKKMLFIKPKTGVKGDWHDAMFKLTGIDFKQIDGIKDFDAKNQIMSNFAKYAKLLLWGEVKIDNTTFKEVTGRDNVIHIVFDDKANIDGKEVDVFDGRTLSFDHYQEVLNKTIGADYLNDSHKTATSIGEGMFIKSKDGRASSSIFLDEGMRTAFEKFFEKNGLYQDLVNEPGWFNNKDTRDFIYQDIILNKRIDRIVPLSALKNIFTRKMGKYITEDANGVKSIDGVQFKEYGHGDSFEVSPEKIGAKTHDETKYIEDAENETIKLSNQILRHINTDYPGGKEAASVFFKAFNDIREESFDKLFKIIEETGGDPMLTIERFEKEFGKKFTDYEKQSFITSAQADNVLNMASNIMKDHITTGVTIKGNKLDLTYIPDYNKVRDVINQSIGENNKDNFIVIERGTYKHLDNDLYRDKDGNLRFLLFRYPIVSRQILNAPIVIWKEDLSGMLGYDYNPHLGAAIAPSHKIVKRIEGDGDGDSVYLVTDERLAHANPRLFQYIDNVFKDETEINVDNKSANLQNTVEGTEWDAEKLFNIISFDTFEGKANIGKIDTDYNKFETMTRLGLVKDDVDQIRYLYGETNQRAVDNKTVNIDSLKKEVEGKIGKGLRQVYDSNNTKIVPSDNMKKNFGKIRVQIGYNKDGTPKYEFLGNIHFTDENAAVAFIKDIDKLLSPGGKIKEKDDKGHFKIGMSEELQNIYGKYNVNVIKNAISNIYWFVGKYDYSEGVPKMKSIKDLSKYYNSISKDVKFIKEKFPEAFEGDPQISFMVDMADKFGHGVFSAFKSKLDDTINTAFQKEIKNYVNEGVESRPGGMKELKDAIAAYQRLSWTHYSRFNEIKNKEQADLTKEDLEAMEVFKKFGITDANDAIEFRQQVKKGLAKMKEEIFSIKAKNPNINIDNIVIQRSGGKQVYLAKELISNETKQALDKAVVFNLFQGRLETVEKYLKSNIDMDTIQEHYGKSDVETFVKKFDESISMFKGLTEEPDIRNALIKNNGGNFDNALEDGTAVIIAKMSNAGVVNHDTIKATATTIQSLPVEDRVQVFRSFQDFSPQDIKSMAEVLGETEIENIASTEILNLFATREISNKMISEDFQNAKPIIQDNATNFTNKNC